MKKEFFRQSMVIHLNGPLTLLSYNNSSSNYISHSGGELQFKSCDHQADTEVQSLAPGLRWLLTLAQLAEKLCFIKPHASLWRLSLDEIGNSALACRQTVSVCGQPLGASLIALLMRKINLASSPFWVV